MERDGAPIWLAAELTGRVGAGSPVALRSKNSRKYVVVQPRR